MKANTDQPVDGLVQGGSAVSGKPGSPMVAPVDPPATRKTWYHNYDEEWADFLAKSSMNKKRPGINNEEAEPLPRVWNAPHV